MGYKVGDEVLVKVRIHHIVNQKTDLPYEVKAINNEKIEPRTIWIREEDIQSDSPMTAEEAWEIAKRIVGSITHRGYNVKELTEIFGYSGYSTILESNTPQEAKEKIEAWEKSKEIHIGDEVELLSVNTKGVVTSFVDGENTVRILCSDGNIIQCSKSLYIKKTGRYIDIQSVLNQIGGAE